MRRLAALLLIVSAGLLSACSSLGSAVLLGRDIAFTAPQLQAQLDRKFPRDYTRLGGLVSFTVHNPRLSLPGNGRLKLDFDVGLAGVGNGSDSPSGRFSLESGLRFDAGSRGLHLDEPRIVSVDMPALGGTMNDTARSMLNRWLVDYALEEPVYRLDDTTFGSIAARRIDRVDIDRGVITLRLD